MTLDELQRLSPEQALQAAATSLSLPDTFFDRMWSTESGRGANMRSQKGAEGHFQIMPTTRAVFEQRDGRAYDPDNFYEGLYLAQAAMKENLARFKDPVDATRAYNAGWNTKRWDNPETNGYVTSLWGKNPPPSTAPTEQAGWPMLPTLKQPKEPKTPDAYDQALGDLITSQPRPGVEDTLRAREDFEHLQAADVAEIARKNAVGASDVYAASKEDPRDQIGLSVWRWWTRLDTPPDPNYDYMARREEAEGFCGADEECRAYMRENAKSLTSEMQAKADMLYQQGLDKTYADAGPGSALLGRFAGGLTDPVAFATGYGVSKVFQLAGIGHAAMVAAGRPAAAVGSLAAENAAANVALTGVSDALGEVKTSADYAGAAAMGVMFSLPFARGVHRQAANEAAVDAARSIRERAIGEQIEKVNAVRTEDPTLTPDQVARTVEQREADQIDTAVREATGPARLDPVIPDDVKQSMADDFQGIKPEEQPAVAAKPSAAKESLAEDLAPIEQPDLIEQIRKGAVTRKVTDTSGAEIKLSWAREPNKLKPHGNLGEALAALQTHPSATIVEKRVAQYLQRVMSEDGLALDIRFNLRDARSTMNPDGGVNINGVTSGIQPQPVDLASQVHGLTSYGVYSVIHEIVHAATWHRINAWETAAGKLATNQRKILAQFQDLFDRYKEEVTNGLPTATDDHGAKYAAKNLHEFAAQILSDSETRQVLSVIPGKPVAGKVSTALREVMSIFRRVLGLDAKITAFHEAAKLVDQIIAMPVDNIRFKDGTPVFAAKAPHVTETPEFRKWFGKSKMVGRDGQPLVMYHGTAHSFDKFEGNKLGLIFVTPDEKFAERFARASADYERTSGQRRGGETIVPVYVKSEKPFDPTLATDRQALADRLIEMHSSYVMGDGQHALILEGRKTLYTEPVILETLADPQSNWAFIEHESILDTIERLGYDSVHVIEDGVKNLAVFEPQQLKSATGNNGEFHPDKPSIVEAGAAQTNGSNPIIARKVREKWAEKMVAHAESYLAAHPIDISRLKVITAKIGGVSDGLRLAGSQSPIMKLVASLVTETTTGAAGRQANVAIRSHMLHTRFVGNAMLDYDNAYTVFRNRNGGGVIEDAWRGAVRRKFDQKVYEEVLSRRVADYQPNADKSVVEAADALEGLFDRSRNAQKDAGVLGWAHLPETSRGYMPQALDGVKLQAATPADMALLHEALTNQFVSRLGFDRKFATDFARLYTERVRERSMGSKQIDGLAAGGDSMQVVRDTLGEMGLDPGMVDRGLAATSKQGQGHTKSRLDVDLLQELRPGLRMMDFYVTNPLVLARSYSKRSAGTVALTEAGIHGIRGVRELRQASILHSAAQPTQEELGAFDRIMAEILGTPVAGQVVSAGATNMSLLVSLQRLGGLVFTQASETFNMLHHTGLRSLLNGVPALAEKLGEVGRLRKGLPSNNHILTSIETYGGEIGMEGYKMVAPLDAPDAALRQYMDQPGLVSRLLRAGGHLQSKISGFRGLLAAQHRMVAEQIVMKAARYIRDGKSDVALRDMGFTPEVAASLRADLDRVAKWDAQDRLKGFDLTRVSDARTAEAFAQAVHRGAAQIIQGTFVGERNAWFHNDYLKLLLQLRTFGLTASEKQWGRTRMNHGYAYASGVMLGQMALALIPYLAKVQLMSAGMSDDAKRKFIKQNLAPGALVKATMNYASITGNTGDVLELLTGIAGGWTKDDKTRALLGVGAAPTSVRSLAPVAATADSLLNVASGRTNLHNSLKQLPFSNLWYVAPAINILKD